MSHPARPASRYGKLAFLVSLALHAAALGWIYSAVTSRDFGAGDGPPAMHLVEFEGEGQSECVLVARPAAGRPGPRHGAPEVAVTVTPETIVPTSHQLSASGGREPSGDDGPPGGSRPPLAGGPPGGSGGQGDGPGRAAGTLFQAGAQARSVVYVIDRSSSMGPDGRLAAASRELLASLSRLPPAARFQVVVYHDGAELLIPGRHELLPATAENVRRAAERLESLPAEGGTRHLPALQLALSLGPEVVHFLTDADDLRDADRREVTRINRGRAVIHTVELTTAHRDRPDMPLQALARENRGSYVAVDLTAPCGPVTE